MQNFEIKIDKEGRWYYNGAHMFRKDIVKLFFENLKQDEEGRYLIEWKGERCYLSVEDTAYVVIALYKTRNPRTNREQVEILLNDDSCEILDMKTVFVGDENVLYCRVKNGRFLARFSRKAYYQLADFIEPPDAEDCFFITLNGERYYISNHTSSLSGGKHA